MMLKPLKISYGNNNIWECINPKNNDYFSKMNEIEIKELLYYLDDYYLDYRDTLNLDSNTTFGVELEYEEISYKVIEKILYKEELYDWLSKKDLSISIGGEVISPILRDNLKKWQELKRTCNILNEYAKTLDHSSTHVHVGAHILGDDPKNLLNFIKLWSAYENIIFHFSYGEHLSARPIINMYSSRLKEIFYADYHKAKHKSVEEILYLVAHRRTQAVNFNNLTSLKEIKPKNTIEFRCPNGTFDPVICQNNINLFTKLLKYAKNSNFNEDIVDRSFKNNLNLRDYDIINLKEALELVDLIFDNNLDKIYFLRQYLKFSLTGHSFIKMSPPFTKYTLTKKKL